MSHSYCLLIDTTNIYENIYKAKQINDMFPTVKITIQIVDFTIENISSDDLEYIFKHQHISDTVNRAKISSHGSGFLIRALRNRFIKDQNCEKR